MRKPYSCKLSEKNIGIDVLFEGNPLLTIPISLAAIDFHNIITNALNGAYHMGYQTKEMEINTIKSPKRENIFPS